MLYFSHRFEKSCIFAADTNRGALSACGLKDRLRSNPLHLIRIMPRQGIEFLIIPLLIY